jgi:hypothetical protein
MPIRCTGRESGAMKVYSIVPSQRSHATVSVRISKTIPRKDQITAPISSFVVSSFRASSERFTPLEMKTIDSVFAIVQTKNAISQSA